MTTDAGVPGVPRFEVVRRGYDRRQVDEHVARLQRVIARMRADLTARSQYGPPHGEMSAYGQQHPNPSQAGAGLRLDPAGAQQPGEPQDAIGGFTDRMQSILQAAEEEAEEIRNKARAAARAELEDLGRQRDVMLSELSEVRSQLEGLLSAQTARLTRPELGTQATPGVGPPSGGQRPAGASPPGASPNDPHRGPAPRPRPRPHPGATAGVGPGTTGLAGPGATGAAGPGTSAAAGPGTAGAAGPGATGAAGGPVPAVPPASASPDAPPAQHPTSQARAGETAARSASAAGSRGASSGIAGALRPRDGAGPDTGVFFRTPAKAESGVDGKAEEPQPPATAADVDAPTGLVSMARPAKPAASNGTSSGEDTVVVKVQPPAAGRSAPSGDGPSGDAPSGDTPDKDGTADTVEVNGGTGRSPSGTRSG